MNGTGQILVQAYTSRAKIPVEGATVIITETTEEGMLNLITVQSTDESGFILPVEVETPLPRSSTHPQDLTVPYSSYDVWVEQPGYAMLVVEGVQVFPNTTTRQPMELSPLSEGESSLNKTTVRAITPQPL